MISGISFNRETKKSTRIKFPEMQRRLAGGEIVWLDLEAPADKDYQSLKKVFGLHELEQEDSQSTFHLPKLDEYADHLFIIWHALNDDPMTSKIEHAQVNIFLGKNFLITVHDKKLPYIDEIISTCCKGQQFFGDAADWILHMIVDRFVDEYFPLIDRISNKIDFIEDNVFTKPDSKEMRKLFVLKHELLEIKKIVAPQRDIISQLSRFENKFISAEHLMYYRDIFDHLIRVLDLVDSGRDVVSGIMDIYLSSISNRMNEIMTRLTIVATIFLPLTLITGIYGMNFRFMPELNWRYWYFVVWGFILAFGVGSYLYYKKKLNW